MCINQTKRKAFKSNSSSFPLANPKSYETIQHLYLYQNKNWPIKVSKNIANFKRCKTTIYSSVISWIKLLKNQSSQLQFVNTFNSNLILTIFNSFVFLFNSISITYPQSSQKHLSLCKARSCTFSIITSWRGIYPPKKTSWGGPASQ